MDRTHSSDATTGPCDQYCLPNESCGVEDGHFDDAMTRYLWMGKRTKVYRGLVICHSDLAGKYLYTRSKPSTG